MAMTEPLEERDYRPEKGRFYLSGEGIHLQVLAAKWRKSAQDIPSEKGICHQFRGRALFSGVVVGFLNEAPSAILPYMKLDELKGVVHSDPEIMGGTPVFVGTRVPLQNLIDYLEGGESIEDFLDAFPTVKREQAIAVIEAGKLTMLRTV
jgi:uncharacterized protein (DUF433 family)